MPLHPIADVQKTADVGIATMAESWYFYLTESPGLQTCQYMERMLMYELLSFSVDHEAQTAPLAALANAEPKPCRITVDAM